MPMIAGTITGPSLRVSASAEIRAAAVNVYRMIADYRDGHQRIIPPQYFRNLEVDAGGYGAGTQIRYDLRAFGTTYHARARITEPEPGRVLVETDLAKGAVTTFTVDSLGGGRPSPVVLWGGGRPPWTSTRALPSRPGVWAPLGRPLPRPFPRRVYGA